MGIRSKSVSDPLQIHDASNENQLQIVKNQWRINFKDIIENQCKSIENQ